MVIRYKSLALFLHFAPLFLSITRQCFTPKRSGLFRVRGVSTDYLDFKDVVAIHHKSPKSK